MNNNYAISEEKEMINLDNPIFVYYINVSGMSRESGDRAIKSARDSFAYTNIVTWIIARNEGESKIECVYDGKIKQRSDELKELIEEINEKIEIMSESNNYDDFKIAIRDWRLKKILE